MCLNALNFNLVDKLKIKLFWKIKIYNFNQNNIVNYDTNISAVSIDYRKKKVLKMIFRATQTL